MMDLNVQFKYLNILCGLLIIICEVINVTKDHTVRDIVIFVGIAFIAALFVSVNYIANDWVQRYFGFLYAWEGRGLTIMYLGWLILGKPTTLFLITGVLCVLTGLGELFVAQCYNRSQPSNMANAAQV